MTGTINRVLAVATGCGAGRSCPGDPVTREQMAAYPGAAFGLSLYGPPGGGASASLRA